jgi:hypothetical protein
LVHGGFLVLGAHEALRNGKQGRFRPSASPLSGGSSRSAPAKMCDIPLASATRRDSARCSPDPAPFDPGAVPYVPERTRYTGFKNVPRRTHHVGDHILPEPQVYSRTGVGDHAGRASQHPLAMGPGWSSSSACPVGSKHRGLGFCSDRRLACGARRDIRRGQRVRGAPTDLLRESLLVPSGVRKGGTLWQDPVSSNWGRWSQLS